MRTSQFLLTTTKETPADAEIISHQLMLRAGLIRKVATGMYNWLPLGMRVLSKVSQIVREEMNRSGALEMLMPSVQPATLWKESGRFDAYGPELLRFKDRHDRDFVFGPTHEEVITDLARRELKSYKQLPVNLYQIQTKFRDEIRPRFGVMRSREFIMKDAYSFHVDADSLDETYQVMYQTYCTIFSRCGLDFRPVEADSGSIGGNQSHEFHVLADSGEDAIAFSDGSNYAVNVELAATCKPTNSPVIPTETIRELPTPNAKTVLDVANLCRIKPKTILKTLIIKDSGGKMFAVIVRGDHQMNEIKVNKLDFIEAPIQMADSEIIRQIVKANPGSIGPVGLDMPLIVDHAAGHLSDFVCGANQDDMHFSGVNWGVDVPLSDTYDIRNVIKGDPSPDGMGKIKIARGIEVGHIFKLGTKYSQALKAEVLTESGASLPMAMGCYGIGVTRIIAAAIEQSYDDKGIVWPESIAPFSVAIVPINYHKSDAVRSIANDLYQTLLAQNVEVLLDDRVERPGVMFADMELIGVPHRITIGERSLANNEVEYKHRSAEESQQIDLDALSQLLSDKL